MRSESGSSPALAPVGVGADEHALAGIVDDHLVEEAVARTAQRAAFVPAFDLERMVVEVEALDRRVGGYCIDALLAARAVELQRRIAVELGIVGLGDRRGAHDV